MLFKVWQQLELQNDHVVSHVIKEMSILCTRRSISFAEDVSEQQQDDVQRQDHASDVERPQDDMLDSDDHSDIDNDISKLLKLTNDGYDSDESDEERQLKEILDKAIDEQEMVADDSLSDEQDSDVDLDSDSSDLAKHQSGGKISNKTGKQTNEGNSSTSQRDANRDTTSIGGATKKRKTEVDDRFFKLADMEEFLDMEDVKEEKRLARERGEVGEEEDDTDNSDDDSIDLFEELPSDDENKVLIMTCSFLQW